MQLDLSNVTLLLIDTVIHDLSCKAIEDSVKHAKFGQLLVFSNRPHFYEGLNANVMTINPFRGPHDWGVFLWGEVAPHLEKDFVLVIQWDSWIIDPTAWDEKFLEYDYIGAPWWYSRNNVGNGGFSWRSRRLMDYLYNNKHLYSPVGINEDVLLCRAMRGLFAQQGFKWPDPLLANKFAFERVRYEGVLKHFGFHGIFNWPLVLGASELEERLKLVRENPYLKSTMLRELPNHLQ